MLALMNFCQEFAVLELLSHRTLQHGYLKSLQVKLNANKGTPRMGEERAKLAYLKTAMTATPWADVVIAKRNIIKTVAMHALVRNTISNKIQI